MEWTERVSAAASPEAVSLWHRLWTLECAYWDEVDFNLGKNATEYFTEDAVYDIGVPGGRNEGRQAIANFYNVAEGQALHATLLHIVNNFALVEWSATTARTRSRITITAREGKPPQPWTSPLAVATSEQTYVATEGDVWRVSSRTHTVYFVGETDLKRDE